MRWGRASALAGRHVVEGLRCAVRWPPPCSSSRDASRRLGAGRGGATAGTSSLAEHPEELGRRVPRAGIAHPRGVEGPVVAGLRDGGSSSSPVPLHAPVVGRLPPRGDAPGLAAAARANVDDATGSDDRLVRPPAGWGMRRRRACAAAVRLPVVFGRMRRRRPGVGGTSRGGEHAAVRLEGAPRRRRARDEAPARIGPEVGAPRWPHRGRGLKQGAGRSPRQRRSG